jgi:hypothetical protein
MIVRLYSEYQIFYSFFTVPSLKYIFVQDTVHYPVSEMLESERVSDLGYFQMLEYLYCTLIMVFTFGYRL